ncbi:sensor histidine kinase [Crocosphaera chwakensis]|uniref:histidine kinase n=1 Tax=Crocosphaera chwakensis CCY0110 TaxID=391612 RepID=A3IN35_9CHRO|nr:histidine kinase dimerization/phospho-acceptor domain-containing protein [Crocosphaera chwakensis]EAZ92012.1 Histidine Kinase [Crocosphaera chwakensis CCY0110]
MKEIETLQKELEVTQLAYEMTAQISQFKSSYLVKTAHELRSPLSSLMGLHQLILEDLCENPEEEKEFLQQGFESAKKLVKIIDRIVTISKIDYGSISLNIERTSLDKVIEKVCELIEFQVKNYSYKIDVKKPEIDIFIQADKEHLIQGLTTLLDTALTLMEKGTITITSQLNERENIAKLFIDIPCCFQNWQKQQEDLQTAGLTLTALKEWNNNLKLSPDMTLILCQTLLKKMGGSLTILDISPENEPETFTRLQCLMPLIRQS